MAEFGYAGEILRVDLSQGNFTRLPASAYAEKFIGGRGFAAKLFWDMVPAGAGALEPENLLTFVTGPAAGFPGVAGNRWQVCGKSPQSQPEAFTYCNLGGLWGLTLKLAGYDALAVQGKADKPVYLFIRDGRVEIKDASHLWGKNTFDTVDYLKAELGPEVKVLTIGPAGENLVVFPLSSVRVAPQALVVSALLWAPRILKLSSSKVPGCSRQLTRINFSK